MTSPIISSLLVMLLSSLISLPFFAHGSEALVESICNATTYPSLCVATVHSDPSWSTADVRGMARIVTKRAITETLVTLEYLSSENVTSEVDHDYHVVVEECAVDYASANASLQDALRTLRAEPFLEARAVEDVTRAEGSFGGCREVFVELSAGPEMLPTMQERIEQLCAIVLGIVDQLTSLNIDINGLSNNVKLVSYD